MATTADLEAAANAATERLRALLEGNLARVVAYLRNDGGAAVRRALAGKEAEEIANLLLILRPEDLEAALLDELHGLLKESEGVLSTLGLATNASEVSIEAYVAHATQATGVMLASVREEGRDALRKILGAGSTSGAPIADLVNDLAAALNTTAFNALIEADTQLMAFDRLVLTRQASADGIRFFLYDGPEPDGIIRPFCEEHVGRVFTLDELDRSNNGDNQPKPVSIYLGGYGCRHYLTPLSNEEAAARRGGST